MLRVTAHECAHVMLALHGKTAKVQQPIHRRKLIDGGSERQTCWHEEQAMKAFAENRETLLAAWNEAPTVIERPVVSVQERRADKTEADLARWLRKLKLAQTKVRKLKIRARYYERAAACKGN